MLTEIKEEINGKTIYFAKQMEKKMIKVYGGILFYKGKQARVIVATKTKKRASELFKVTYSRFKDFFCETGNKYELKFALLKPETVFYGCLNHPEDGYKILEKVK